MDFRDEATYRPTRRPVTSATTLLPDAYRSPEFFALERDAVFARGWVAIGFTHEVSRPGQTIVRSVGGRSIVVTMDLDGVRRAFFNVCRHRGSELVAGDCQIAKRFRCRYHAWAYALDGTCVGTPLFEGSPIPEDQQGLFDMSETVAFDRADHGLLPVAVESWEFLLMVDLSRRAMPLGDWLGDLPSRVGGYGLGGWSAQLEMTYGIAANWKLVAENFMEYYHLPWVHPELMKVSRMEDHHRFQGPGLYTGMATSPISRSDTAAGWHGLPPGPDVAGEDLVSGRFVHLFPNVALSILPNHAFVMLLEPEAHDRTRERTVLFAPDASVAADPASLGPLGEFWDHVNREDIDIVEAVQRGISIPEYPGGRMCYRFEEPLHRFQNIVIDRMVGIDRVPAGDVGEATVSSESMSRGDVEPGQVAPGDDRLEPATDRAGAAGEPHVGA